jgi:4-hydroxyphenylpyruvate dioxygenase-like putative hemolysin
MGLIHTCYRITGYGHIAITTDDIHGALAKLAAQGIEPEKPPSA